MLGILALLIAAEAPARAPVLPAWMAGCWERHSGDKWTEECWTAPRAGIMLGSGRSGAGEKLHEWEVMQIVLDQPNGDGPTIRMAFWGAPNGVNCTLFAWSPSAEPGVTFVNENHDYPQRIRYWRDGKELVAEIALKDGSKAVSWRYKPMGN